ncbi:T9SS type A sorting domain-containing protein [Persicobacter sp. CCB-QB2]|uniref:T9SS type A sorting domain-containing protein n=1 Tax=Persicobacter sp. CCB-QB2 TaxID=1561025 RepID=UPI0006A9FE98|nr:T9SS type A sorting domain-containing protein [Persicobacter sp. CCB-QB2]
MGQTVTWTGAAGDNLWSTIGNWENERGENQLPTSQDLVDLKNGFTDVTGEVFAKDIINGRVFALEGSIINLYGTIGFSPYSIAAFGSDYTINFLSESDGLIIPANNYKTLNLAGSGKKIINSNLSVTTFDASSASSVEFQGAVAVPSGSYGDLVISGSGVKTMKDDYIVNSLTATSDVKFNGGVGFSGASAYSFENIESTTGAITVDGTLNVGGEWVASGTIISTGTVVFNSSSEQTIPQITYSSLSLSGGKKLLNHNLNYTGVFDPSGAIVEFTGGVTVIPAVLNYGSVLVNTSSAVNLSGNYGVTDTFIANSDVNLNNTTHFLETGLVEFNNKVTTSDIKYELTVEGDVNLGSGARFSDVALYFNGASDQTFSALDSVPDVVVEKPSGKLIPSNIEFSGNLQLTSGNLSWTASSRIAGNLTIGSSFSNIETSQTAPLTFSGKETQSITTNGKVIDYFRLEKTTGTLTPTDELQISKELQIAGGVLNTNDNVTLLASASSQAIIPEITGGEISGNVNVEVYFPYDKQGYAQFNAPVNGMAFNDWAGQNGQIVEVGGVHRYNESINKWEALTASELASATSAGEGYNIYVYNEFINSGNTKLTSTGGVNQGNVTKGVTLEGDGVGVGFNCIANPYAAPISSSEVLDAHFGKIQGELLQVRNMATGGYTQIVRNGQNDGFEFSLGQAFFIQATENFTFNFQESFKTNSANVKPHRTQNNGGLMTFSLLDDQGNEDNAFLRGTEEDMLNFYSVYKLKGAAHNIALQRDSIEMVMLGFDEDQELDSLVLPIWVNFKKIGSYEIKLNNKIESLDAFDLILFDHYTQDSLVAEGGELNLNFEVSQEPSSYASDRFSLQIVRKKIITDLDQLREVRVFPNPVTSKKIHVDWVKQPTQIEVAVFNISGTIIDNFPLNGTVISGRKWLSQPGIYFLTLKANGVSNTHKIIVN